MKKLIIFVSLFIFQSITPAQVQTYEVLFKNHKEFLETYDVSFCLKSDIEREEWKKFIHNFLHSNFEEINPSFFNLLLKISKSFRDQEPVKFLNKSIIALEDIPEFKKFLKNHYEQASKKPFNISSEQWDTYCNMYLEVGCLVGWEFTIYFSGLECEFQYEKNEISKIVVPPVPRSSILERLFGHEETLKNESCLNADENVTTMSPSLDENSKSVVPLVPQPAFGSFFIPRKRTIVTGILFGGYTAGPTLCAIPNIPNAVKKIVDVTGPCSADTTEIFRAGMAGAGFLFMGSLCDAVRNKQCFSKGVNTLLAGLVSPLKIAGATICADQLGILGQGQARKLLMVTAGAFSVGKGLYDGYEQHMKKHPVSLVFPSK